jgi:SAM-dependent methyltransferase
MDDYKMRVRSDFDRIARLDAPEAGDYDDFLLAQVPRDCRRAVELGCGTGAFARRLAERAVRVTAIDFSPEMIAVARARSQAHSNLQYLVADVAAWDFGGEPYEFIASLATLHHLPLAETLAAMARGLTPGGTLVAHDLYRDDGLVDWMWSGAALVWSRLEGRRRASPEARAAWAAHAKNDVLSTLDEIRSVASAVLPGADLHRHLKWRYSLVWRKPATV